MLSASHNPMPDNGIKFFARGGNKLDDALENAIESRMRRELGPAHRRRGRPGDRGRVPGRGLHLPPGQQPGPAGQPGGPQGRRRLRQRRGVRRRARRRSRPRGPRWSGSTPTPDGININDELRLDPHGLAARRPWSPSRPTWASPWTATRTAAWPWTPTGRIVDGDQILAILALAHARGRPAEERHGGGHGDEQPRLRPGDAGRRDHGRADPGGRPLRAGGDEGRRILPRRRAVRARGDVRARDHRRRRADRAAPDEPDGRDPDQPGRPGRR